MTVVVIALLLLLGVLSVGLGTAHLLRPVSYGSTVGERALASFLILTGVAAIVFSGYLANNAHLLGES